MLLQKFLRGRLGLAYYLCIGRLLDVSQVGTQSLPRRFLATVSQSVASAETPILSFLEGELFGGLSRLQLPLGFKLGHVTSGSDSCQRVSSSLMT